LSNLKWRPKEGRSGYGAAAEPCAVVVGSGPSRITAADPRLSAKENDCKRAK
jgi:hypothetical protein